MCNINENSNFKTKTVYKAVKKLKGRYFSFFSGFEIRTGPVDPEWKISKLNAMNEEFQLRCSVSAWLRVRPYVSTMPIWNPNIVGKTTGFGSLKWAKSIFDHTKFQKPEVDFAILKIVLGGDIMKGNAANISNHLPEKVVTWAGSEIISFEEIYCIPSAKPRTITSI